MSLLKKPELKKRWKKLWLVAVSLLLLVPSFAAAAFAMRFEVEPFAQDPAQQQDREKLRQKETEVRMREGEVTDEMKMRMAADPELREKMMRRMELEIKAKEAAQAAMVRLARINMDQAIQVATSQYPGKVLHANLGAKGWEEPGKLGKDGVVFYRVIIANETGEGSTHVWVNAIDGSLIKTEKELPRKKLSENP